MSDIRDTIEGDRGVWKKVQAFLPGYKRYRNCEDLRAADSILRAELAVKMDTVVEAIQNARVEIARGMDFDLLNRIGELVNNSQALAEKIRHASQGYSPWISGDVRIEEPELNRLYEYDLSLFTDMTKLTERSDRLLAASRKGAANAELLLELADIMASFEVRFDSRIAKVTEVAQE